MTLPGCTERDPFLKPPEIILYSPELDGPQGAESGVYIPTMFERNEHKSKEIGMLKTLLT